MTDANDIRRVAIDHHDSMTDVFESNYRKMEADKYASAFTYGRTKIDSVIYHALSECPRGGSVLDIGCGTGEYLRIANRYGLDVAGVEPAPRMLQVARKNVPGGAIEQGVATRLPFEDGAFDLVLLIEVLRYLHNDDIQQALREARRVLRPSGRVIATFVNRWALDGFFIKQRARQWRKGKAFDERNPHCEFHTPGEARRAFKEAGFAKVESAGRMLAPLRLAWKLDPTFGAACGRTLNAWDDRVHTHAWTHAFAGHLIVIGTA